MRNAFEILTDAIREQMQQKHHLEFVVGARELGALGGTRRVVWIPAGGTLGPVALAPYSKDGVRISPMYSNAIVMVAHLYAEDLNTLIALWVDLLTATRKVFGKAAVPSDWTLDTEGDRAGFVHGHAVALRQQFTFNLFLSEYAPKTVAGGVYGSSTARLTTMDLTFELEDAEGGS